MAEFADFLGFNFSDQVIDIISRAKDEANEHEHPYITVEDLLLAILTEGASSAFEIIASLTKDFGTIEDDIEKREQAIREGRLINPLRVRAETAFEFAKASAERSKRTIIESEDILLGIIQAASSFASRLLAKRNLSKKVFMAFTGQV